ncbi:acyltransferase-domain-containing protein [Rhizodiscina lignyota]|uniref:Acyltransferase-domain-containing protein n=1 Tax=Rhizodiscina lignyota TaxID=1504668 RepID=A0A9P4M1X6_9PEZI|nr:acyltransferase-domain-containing protein [Rhizodiscina lignyota]
MASEGVRQRAHKPNGQGTKVMDEKCERDDEPHPGGAIKHGAWEQALRIALFGLYYVGSCVSIHLSQILGSWLYFYDQEWYYAFMALTKQHFGILVVTMQQWWSPIKMRVSWDKSVRGQIRQTEDGRLETDFPERMVLIANHQIYSDWLYLWWIAYTARLHGHLYIILKESLKWIPLIGPAMQFYSFIFLSRKWETDKPRIAHRLQKLNMTHPGPGGKRHLSPMWLLIFPEGTNASENGRKKSKSWADKTGIEDARHVLLPRSTGLQFCLEELHETVDYIYDCTMAYEGVGRSEYAQDIYTLYGLYFQGRRPKSVNLHWRRFLISEVPFNDTEKFNAWILERWREKDEMIEQYLNTGRFPADNYEDEPKMNGHAPGKETTSKKQGRFIETEVKPVNRIEFLQMFVPWLAVALAFNVLFKLWRMLKVLMFWR